MHVQRKLRRWDEQLGWQPDDYQLHVQRKLGICGFRGGDGGVYASTAYRALLTLINCTLTSNEGGGIFYSSGDHLRKGIALLENMMEKYPDSVLAYHARFALGKSLSRHFKDYSQKKIRPPDYRRSLEHLKKVKVAKSSQLIHTGRKT